MTQELFDKIDVNVLLLLEDNNIYEVFSRGHVPKIELKTIEDLWTHMIKSDIDYSFCIGAGIKELTLRKISDDILYNATINNTNDVVKIGNIKTCMLVRIVPIICKLVKV